MYDSFDKIQLQLQLQLKEVSQEQTRLDQAAKQQNRIRKEQNGMRVITPAYNDRIRLSKTENVTA